MNVPAIFIVCYMYSLFHFKRSIQTDFIFSIVKLPESVAWFAGSCMAEDGTDGETALRILVHGYSAEQANKVHITSVFFV